LGGGRVNLFELWEVHHDTPGWLNICRTLGVDDRDLRELEDIDDFLIRLNGCEWIDKTAVNHKIRELIQETDYRWSRDRRRHFLKDVVGKLSGELGGAYKAYQDSFDNDESYDNRVILSCLIDDLNEVKAKHDREIRALSAPGDRSRVDLSVKIEQAKQRQFSDFIELDRHHKALCPFHEDRNPSFSVRETKGHCFGCGWHGDIIDFIQEREGLSFPEAVKLLTGGGL
jgi:hypothetical protein